MNITMKLKLVIFLIIQKNGETLHVSFTGPNSGNPQC